MNGGFPCYAEYSHGLFDMNVTKWPFQVYERWGLPRVGVRQAAMPVGYTCPASTNHIQLHTLSCADALRQLPPVHEPPQTILLRASKHLRALPRIAHTRTLRSLS